MRLDFGYGTGVQTVELPEENLLGVLAAKEIRHGLGGEEAVRYALAHPIGAKPLRESVAPGKKIAIIASDISRPVPSYEILPAILDELTAAGCRDEDVTPKKKNESSRATRYLTASAARTPTRTTASTSARRAPERPWTSRAAWRRRTSESAPATSNFTTLLAIPAAQRQSCRAFPPRRQFRRITA